MKYVTLSGTNEIKMPIVGLGTWRAQPQDVVDTIVAALECGYRHFDTAFNYNNEEAIGQALKKWIESGNGSRQDLFVTTKLPNFGNRASDVEKYLTKSLKNLQLDYLDLYLIHMPFAFVCNDAENAPAKNEDGSFKLDTNNNFETWKVMEEQVKKGLIKNIGVSNFNAQQLKTLHEKAEIKPSVLQIELHAYMQQKELREVCKELNVAVTAYSPLGSPGANKHFSTKYNYNFEDFPDILGHPTVANIANTHGKSPGQILLKHLVQKGVIVIPKSGNPKRIKENISIFDFDLSNEEVEMLDGLDKGDKGRIFDFKFFNGVLEHPEYPFAKP